MGILWFCAGAITVILYICFRLYWAGKNPNHPKVKEMNIQLAKELLAYCQEKYNLDVSLK